jgi:hypothetical protein
MRRLYRRFAIGLVAGLVGTSAVAVGGLAPKGVQAAQPVAGTPANQAVGGLAPKGARARAAQPVAGTPANQVVKPRAELGPPPGGTCPLDNDGHGTVTKNFSFGPNTATVVLNLYYSSTYFNGLGYGCFNGYERIFVSSGSGVFGSDSAGSDWLQYFYSENTGTTFDWVNNPPTTCESDGNAAALINDGSDGQCGSSFTFPRNSMAWVENEDWELLDSPPGNPVDCILIQNTPGYVPEYVYNSTNTVHYQVPTEQLHDGTDCSGIK